MGGLGDTWARDLALKSVDHVISAGRRFGYQPLAYPAYPDAPYPTPHHTKPPGTGHRMHRALRMHL